MQIVPPDDVPQPPRRFGAGPIDLLRLPGITLAAAALVASGGQTPDGLEKTQL